ncbi:MAG: hypothetical protein KKH20_05605, partial [Proteobacteria bacterium]|nr:hypothetical protein [Pseudomonadota bacterium]
DLKKTPSIPARKPMGLVLLLIFWNIYKIRFLHERESNNCARIAAVRSFIYSRTQNLHSSYLQSMHPCPTFHGIVKVRDKNLVESFA